MQVKVFSSFIFFQKKFYPPQYKNKKALQNTSFAKLPCYENSLSDLEVRTEHTPSFISTYFIL